MTPQDTMRLAIDWLDQNGGAHIADELREALAQQVEADPNAPWMTEAHMLCTDHGIPQGNLTERIRALRDKLAQQVAKPNCNECAKWVQRQADNREWMEGVAKGRRIVEAVVAKELQCRSS